MFKTAFKIAIIAIIYLLKKLIAMLGSVGRAVASNPEVRGSNPAIGIYCQLFWKDENKEKESGNWPYLKKTYHDNIVEAIIDHRAHV